MTHVTRDDPSYCEVGSRGAVAGVLLGGLLIAVQESEGFSSPLQKSVNHVWLFLASPILRTWEVFGVRGAEDLRLVIPMVLSVLLFLGGLGFLVGVFLRKTTCSK